MARPDIVPVTASDTQTGGGGRRLFISYSHKDGELASAFWRALCVMATGRRQLGLDRAGIFIDADGLKAGDNWNERIESALAVADVFVLLVSINSLSSDFCMTKELGAAASQGCKIICVLLSETPGWDTHLIDRDPEMRTLGALNAAPKHARINLRAVRDRRWDNRDAALTAAANQIGDSLEMAPMAVADPAPRRATRTLAPLLPFFCNQEPSEVSFDAGISLWQPGQALLLLVKGQYEDHTPGFWTRLRHKNLADYCEVLDLQPLEPRGLALPPVLGPDKQPRKDLLLAMRGALSDALLGNKYKLRGGSELGAALTALAGVQALYGTLPSEGLDAAAASLTTLLSLIEQAPAGAPLERLALAVMVEDASLIDAESVASLFGLQGRFPRVAVVELQRLQPLTPEEVRRWHRHFDLGDQIHLDEAQLVLQLFSGADTLRHRPFDKCVRPLLGLTAKELRP